MKEAMKQTGIRWIGEIPSEWDVIRAKHFSYMKGRIGWQGLTSDEFMEQGPYLVTGTDFENGRVCWDRSYHITEKRYDEAPQIQLKKDDLLVTKDGTIGKLAYIDGLPDKASLNSHLLVIRPLQEKYINRFLFWVLNSTVFVGYYELVSDGSTMDSLSQEKMGNLKFPIPSIAEQEAIADFLDMQCGKLDEIIVDLEKQIDILQKYKKSLITETVTKGLNKNVPLKITNIPWIPWIPKNWEYHRIKDYATTTSGGTPDTGDDSLYDGDINWICSYDLSESSIYQSGRKITVQGSNCIAGKIQHKGCILVAMYGGSGTIGNSGFLECDARTNQAVCSIDFNRKIYVPKYAFYHTIFLREYWMYYAVGSRKDPNINQDIIKNMKYICPPVTEQHEIANYLDNIIPKINETLSDKEEQLSIIVSHKQSLIFEYVTGKKRLKEVKKNAD